MCVCEFEKVRVKSVRYTYSKNDERCMRFVFPLREFIDHIEKGELECDCRWAGIYHITFTKEWVIISRSYIICAPSINLIRSLPSECGVSLQTRRAFELTDIVISFDTVMYCILNLCMWEFEKGRVNSVRYAYSKNDERCVRFVFPLIEFVEFIGKGQGDVCLGQHIIPCKISCSVFLSAACTLSERLQTYTVR